VRDLGNGVLMPVLGLGVWQMDDGRETEQAVEWALEAGYRHIDTATYYRNEASVGAALARSGLPREELFVTTKWLPVLRGPHAELRRSLERLALAHVDLYLIHWPVPAKSAYLDTWKAFEQISASGRARAIGVSNFQAWHLQPLLDRRGIVPAVNQVELHPAFQQERVRAFDRAHGIVTEAWSPLAQGDVLADPVITVLSRRYGKTPAQIVLRWHIELGNVVIPKSVTPSRIRENIDIFDFSLTADDMAAVRALDRAARTGPDPDGGEKPAGFSSTGGRWVAEGTTEPT